MDKATAKSTLETINRMQSDGVVELYAIGGVFGATFYLPSLTASGLEVFVLLPSRTKDSSESLTPLDEYLTAHGDRADGERIVGGSWPVKFLPVTNGLEREALDESVPKDLDGTKTWVMTAEHLVCMALRDGNMALVSQFLDSEVVDRNKLHLMLHQHELGPQWHQFNGTPSEK